LRTLRLEILRFAELSATRILMGRRELVAMPVFRSFTHRHHAAVRHLALGVLKLNGSVDNAEFVTQAFFYVAQYALAH
jgi:hypothetical protein